MIVRDTHPVADAMSQTGLVQSTLLPTDAVSQRVKPDPEPHDLDEASLIDDAQAGDRSAFAALIERYWDRLYRWLYHLTRDPHTAEDLAQETFLKAFAAVKSFRAGSNFRAWLFRIAHNNFVNQRRSNKRTRLPLPAELPQPGESPVEELLGREGIERLSQAVRDLPSDYRGALMLRAEEGLSFKQIAEILNITEQTARWRVFKARQKLMSVLTPDYFPASQDDSPIEPEPNRNQP